MKLSGNLESYTDLELALLVYIGVFGNGQARKTALGNRYVPVQAIVENLVRGIVPAGSEATPDELRKVIKSMRPTEGDMNDIADEIIRKFF